MDVVIETRGEHTFGMTVAEKRSNKRGNENVDVAVTIDADAFVRDLIQNLVKI
jgi:inosine-uridine nucleoside N-ribohydrolase